MGMLEFGVSFLCRTISKLFTLPFYEHHSTSTLGVIILDENVATKNVVSFLNLCFVLFS